MAELSGGWSSRGLVPSRLIEEADARPVEVADQPPGERVQGAVDDAHLSRCATVLTR